MTTQLSADQVAIGNVYAAKPNPKCTVAKWAVVNVVGGTAHMVGLDDKNHVAGVTPYAVGYLKNREVIGRYERLSITLGQECYAS